MVEIEWGPDDLSEAYLRFVRFSYWARRNASDDAGRGYKIWEAKPTDQATSQPKEPT